MVYNPKSHQAEEFISDAEVRETLAYSDANKNNIELGYFTNNYLM